MTVALSGDTKAGGEHNLVTHLKADILLGSLAQRPGLTQ